MAVYPATKTDFEQHLMDNELVVIDFWAQWCAPCKMFATVFEKVSDNYPDLKFLNVNIEKESELADYFNVQSIPHLLIIKQAVLLYSESGSMPESTLKELLDQAVALDVTDIKKDLEGVTDEEV